MVGATPKATQNQASASLTVQQSSYGTPIYLLYGTNRITGNLLWYGAFQAIQQSNSGGGKGGVVGGGGKGGGSGQYQYYASFAIGLCEGPISAIGDVYVSKQVTNVATLNGSIFTGTQGQSAWGYLTTNFPSQALQYSELAYVGFPNFSLGTSSETPQFSFETFGLLVFGSGIQDASPGLVFIDFIERSGVPSTYIDTFTELENYCRSMGFFISPLFDQQEAASDWLKEIMDSLNCEFVWYPSQGYITAKSYGTTPVSGNGASYVPNLSPIYSIGSDDFLRDGDTDPVQVTRADVTDIYNQYPIEYVNRNDQYNVETYTAFDDALVDAFGPRPATTLRAHHITDPNEAQQMANIAMNRQIYIRNQYTFKLPWNYILLDPMDLIEITDPLLGLNNYLVRVVSIEEDEKTGALTFVCEDVPGAIASPALNPNFGTTRSTPNYNQDPGYVNTPIFFESPLALLQAPNVEVDIGISGSNPLWGGCDIWISTDGITYQYLAQYNGKTRMGVLTASLPTFTVPAGGNSIDGSSTLKISMAESLGSLNNAATTTDATSLNTLCYVDGEFICYGNDVLTATNAYNLTYLNRGCYGSTIGAHASGSNFVRFDSSVFKYEADQNRVGQTLQFKFLSFNLWGGGQQDIGEVPAYSYTLLGTALLTSLANPSALAVSYLDNIAQLNWQPITDIRSPILYQIRKGSTFAAAQVIGVTATTTFPVYGTDTYWVTALYYTPTGVPVLSSSPPSIAVSTPSLAQYLVESWDEASTSWSGTLSGSAQLVGGNIEVNGSANLLSASNILTIPNLLNYAAAAGIYTAPNSHIISSNYIINAKVIIDWALSAESSTSDITALVDIPTTPDVTGAVSSSLVQAIPQINLSQDGGVTWSGWQNWVPGVYTFDAIDFQIVIYSLSLNVIAILSDLSITVDVPLRTDSGTSTSSSSADTTVSFPNGEFNELLIVTPTVVGGNSGDNIVITATTLTNFTYSVYNSGSRVVRNISYTAQGY